MRFRPSLVTVSLLTASLFLMTACDGFLDVNEDPTRPSEVPENLQLSGLLGVFSFSVLGNEPARATTQWTQQLAWTGFQPSTDNYDYDESNPNNYWNTAYVQVLSNARELQRKGEANGNHAYVAMAKVVEAWAWSMLTDFFGDVPFSAALDPENTTPGYDTQEEIYPQIIALLEEAIEDFGRNNVQMPASDDLLYGGDLDRWERMTYTLLARLHMRLSNAPGYDAAEQAQLALEALGNGFQGNGDDADFQYFASTGEENPWYQFAIDGKWDTRNQLSGHYIDLLEDLDDPRLTIQARPAGAVDNNGVVDGFSDDTPEYIGHVNGEEGDGAVHYSSVGSFYSDAGAPLTWLSYAEAKFIEAEATLILDGATAAQQPYEDAIRASMEKLGIDEGDIDSYIAQRTQLAVADSALEEVITQKYIANFLSYEPYNDWRRTGYPELEPIEEPWNPSGEIPVRFPYPSSELSNNSASVSATGIPAGLASHDHPVWWQPAD